VNVLSEKTAAALYQKLVLFFSFSIFDELSETNFWHGKAEKTKNCIS
jgi:hypothetical protein